MYLVKQLSPYLNNWRPVAGKQWYLPNSECSLATYWKNFKPFSHTGGEKKSGHTGGEKKSGHTGGEKKSGHTGGEKKNLVLKENF